MADRGEKLQAALQAAKATVEDLERKKASAERELERLTKAKGPLVLPAATGDQSKQRHLDKLNQKIVEQQLRVADLGEAIELAQAQVSRIEVEIERAGDAGKAEELAERHGRLMEADRACDRLMELLAAALGERVAIVGEIQRAMGPGLLRRLGLDPHLATWATWRAGKGGKGVISRALKHAGLGPHADFGYVGSPEHYVPLGKLSYPEIETVIAALRHEESAEQKDAA